MLSLPRLCVAVLATIACCTRAQATDLEMSKSAMARLASLPHGGKSSVDGFPVGPARNSTVDFQRVQIYAPDAHLYLIDANGQREIPRSNQVFLRGYTEDGRARVALSLKKDGSFANGNGSGPDGSFAVRARIDSKGVHHLFAIPLEDAKPAGFKYDFRCGNEGESLLVQSPDQLTSAGVSAVATSSPSTFSFGTVAVDTDSLFMSQLFSNNTTSAANWIAKMFNTMNTMYENDLHVHLVQGTTFLRVGSDPYGNITVVPADRTDLDKFGTYWQANYGSVKRTFATLLSGRGPCSSCGSGCVSCNASGIAWINQYCQGGFLGNGGGGPNADLIGSYSVVQVFASSIIDPNADIAARLTGHELGHNFGADHTHCTDKTTGAFKVASNTIDTCYNGEGATHGGGQCYDGNTLTCPGAGAGTIMSYCNVTGCPSGTDNLLQFNGTQITKTLVPNVTAQTPGCLFVDAIFANGFN